MKSWTRVALVLSCIISVGAQTTPNVKGSAYRVVHGWPVLPEGYVLGQVSGVAVDSHNHVWVFHRAERSWPAATEPRDALITAPAILCFDGASGKLLSSWGERKFRTPHGLRVDAGDNLWVTDLDLQQVFKFDHSGNLLMTIGEKGVAGADATHFNRPADVAVAGDGSVYVADGYGNSRIAHFSGRGEFLGEWGRRGDAPGEFNTPHSVVVGAGGRVYVADRQNSRVQVFTPDGEFLTQWKSLHLGRPWGLALGPDNNLYMVDGGDLKPQPPDRGRLLKLTGEGRILATWSSFGNYDGQLYWGHDIAVGRDGAVYVGDVYHGMRVQKFVPAGSRRQTMKRDPAPRR